MTGRKAGNTLPTYTVGVVIMPTRPNAIAYCNSSEKDVYDAGEWAAAHNEYKAASADPEALEKLKEVRRPPVIILSQI